MPDRSTLDHTTAGRTLRDPDGRAAMPPTARAELRSLVDDYFTCEFATLSTSGVPVAWPAVALVDPDTGSVTLTTSIAAPRKAFNIRRDPRVALLFSDPTGSRHRDLPQVLVRGTAVCPDEIHTSPAGLEEYWSRQYRRQPASLANSATALSRWLMDLYYLRLVITVTPTSVEVLPPLPDLAPGDVSRVGRSDLSPYAQLARKLPPFRSGVLSWSAGAEPPVVRRVRLSADPVEQQLRLTTLGGAQPPTGPASLLAHYHDEKMWDLRQTAALGQVVAAGDGVAFRPERLLPAPAFDAGPLARLSLLRDLRRTGRRYLERRQLSRPRVAWDEFKRLQPTRKELSS